MPSANYLLHNGTSELADLDGNWGPLLCKGIQIWLYPIGIFIHLVSLLLAKFHSDEAYLGIRFSITRCLSARRSCLRLWLVKLYHTPLACLVRLLSQTGIFECLCWRKWLSFAEGLLLHQKSLFCLGLASCRLLASFLSSALLFLLNSLGNQLFSPSLSSAPSALLSSIFQDYY